MKSRLAPAAAATAIVSLGLVASASAQTPAKTSAAFECRPGIACFYETTAFSGNSVQYSDPSPGCTLLPFAPGSLFNWGDKDIYLYTTSNCTGTASLEPANNFHSYPARTFPSFQAS
ncbi:peptidase inhibitor family I36 protein [Kribbella qitaiheensis]|uniref:peptidase inhibitor family I36 protein n=1 Tax=Kribbella qitaiheensis TaxID=1544730 RepID=UPI0036243A85